MTVAWVSRMLWFSFLKLLLLVLLSSPVTVSGQALQLMVLHQHLVMSPSPQLLPEEGEGSSTPITAGETEAGGF